MEKMKIVYCEPGKPAIIKSVDNNWDSLTALVGEEWYVGHPFARKEICVFFGKTDQNEDKPMNRRIPYESYPKSRGIICKGAFFVCEVKIVDGRNTICGLTDEDAEEYCTKINGYT